MSAPRFKIGSRVIAAKPRRYEWPGEVIEVDAGGPLERTCYRVRLDPERAAAQYFTDESSRTYWYEEAELKPDLRGN